MNSVKKLLIHDLTNKESQYFIKFAEEIDYKNVSEFCSALDYAHRNLRKELQYVKNITQDVTNICQELIYEQTLYNLEDKFTKLCKL